MLPAIARYLNISVVRSRPDDLAVFAGLRNRLNLLELPRIRIVDRQPARKFLMLPRRIVRRQIRRNSFPRFSVIARPKQKLRPQINRSPIVRAHLDRSIPVESKLRFARTRQRLDLSRFARRLAKARDLSTLIFRVCEVSIRRVGKRPEAIPKIYISPVPVCDSIRRPRRPHPRAVILQ